MKFKNFLLEESKLYFGQKIADILSAVQDLNSSLESMGTKHLVSNAENIVNQMRRIIHTNWPEKQQDNLRILQKCAVAIMKGIEEKDDLPTILKACQEQLEVISGESKTPVNNISVDEK